MLVTSLSCPFRVLLPHLFQFVQIVICVRASRYKSEPAASLFTGTHCSVRVSVPTFAVVPLVIQSSSLQAHLFSFRCFITCLCLQYSIYLLQPWCLWPTLCPMSSFGHGPDLPMVNISSAGLILHKDPWSPGIMSPGRLGPECTVKYK